MARQNTKNSKQRASAGTSKRKRSRGAARRKKPSGFLGFFQSASNRAQQRSNQRNWKSRGMKSVNASIAQHTDDDYSLPVPHLILRTIIGIFLIFPCFISTVAIFEINTAYTSSNDFWPQLFHAEAFLYFSIGSFLMLGWFWTKLFRKTFLYLYVLGHELTHAFFIFVCGGKVSGFKVTPELIEKVKTGIWDPDKNKDDMDHRDALAARGYWQAFQAVKSSIKNIYDGENSGKVVDNDYPTWYQELFAPSVRAGIIKASDLAGFRSGHVIITGSMHSPPSPEAVRDAMPTLFDLLIEEKEPSVRAVLGHFIFVFIHPYTDGNGRMARFLMNTQLISGGYPWTIINVEDRNKYMAALEKASTKNDISDFAKLIARKVNKGMS